MTTQKMCLSGYGWKQAGKHSLKSWCAWPCLKDSNNPGGGEDYISTIV